MKKWLRNEKEDTIDIKKWYICGWGCIGVTLGVTGDGGASSGLFASSWFGSILSVSSSEELYSSDDSKEESVSPSVEL